MCFINSNMCVITNGMVTAATTDVTREEFLVLSTMLSTITDRSQRVQHYHATMATASDNAKCVTRMFSDKEKQHIDHVRNTMARIPEFSADRKPHDFSKDDLYFFVTSAKFSCGVKGEGLDKLFDIEVTRHYTLEPHHPQYEGIHGVECAPDDIREMAIDRMSRSIQVFGRVNLDDMEKYMPDFELGDNTTKRAQYRGYLAQHKEITEGVYYEMFPKAKP